MENALSPEFPTAALRAAAIVSLLLAIAGCSVFKTNEEAQTAINQRVVGMSVGDFFDRYGSWNRREAATRRHGRVRLGLGHHGQSHPTPASTDSTTAPAR